MKNRLRIGLIAIACVVCTAMTAAPKQVVSFDKRAVSDSLTAFAARQASVGKIRVSTVKVKNDKLVEVFASRQLSTIPFSADSVEYLYEMVSRIVLGRPDGEVRIYCDDKQHEISRLISSFRRGDKELAGDDVQRIPYKLKKVQPLTKNTSVPYSVTSGLEGQHLAVYGSHGIYFHQGEQQWLWQRAKILTTVEDLYTTGYTMPFLVPMLENAGAVVLQPRERDTQLHEVIVDNTEAETLGDWVSVKTGGWGRFGEVLVEGENPFTMGGYNYKPAGNDQSSLTYRPQLPEAGEYAVYVSYKTENNSTESAQYTVCHRGIKTTYAVNQRMGGNMWVYLGTFDFSTNPSQNYVQLSGNGPAGKVVTGDAVKFGGGWGCVARYQQPETIENVPSAKEGTNGKNKRSQTAVVAVSDSVRALATISGYPRWIEGARYWMQYSGVPDSVYNYTGSKNDYIDDYASRGRWMNWLAGGSSAIPEAEGQHIPVTIGLAFHTDAGNIKKDSIVGTLAIYTDFDGDKETVFPTGASRSKNRDFADYVQTQIVEDVRAQYAPEWTRRMLHNSSYSESRTPKIPSMLLELLSHQNFADMRYGLDPRFRFTVSRAIYKAMLRFLHEQYGTPYVVQPLPVKDFAAEIEDNHALLSWRHVSDPLEPTAEPEYYVLYTRIEDGDWDNGQKVSYEEGTYLSQPIEQGKRYDFKVVAGNAGGISFPSEVLSVYKAPKEKGRVLIVNGFTRVGAPEMLANEDELAGFQTESYPIAYKKDVIYIGGQYDFMRSHPWTSDEDQGYGASYADKAKETEAGNMFDYPVMHGKALQQKGYSFVSCAASAVDSSMLAAYDVVDIIMGKQKETCIGVEKQVKEFKTFTPSLQAALRSYKGSILCSGSFLGTDMRTEDADICFAKDVLHYKYRTHHATRSGQVRMERPFAAIHPQLVMEQNPKILPSENNDAIRPMGENARIVARYDDSGLPAGIVYQEGGQKQLIFSFPLESLKEFNPLYLAAIEWLSKHE